MVINKKSISFMFIILLLLVVGAFSYFMNINKSAADPHVETASEKIIGSEQMDPEFYRLPISSLNDLTDKADLIIIGKAITEGKTVRKSVPVNPLSEKTKTNSGALSTYPVTQVEVEVSQVLYGDPNVKQLSYVQLGEATSDKGQTKVLKNSKQLFILATDADGTYASVDFEEGVFKIFDDQTVESFSNNSIVAQYDKKDVKELVKGITKAKKKK